MIRQMTSDHEKQLRELQDDLQKERHERIEQQNKALEYFEELQLMRRRLFGRSAERLSEEDRKQLWLFNEAEMIAAKEQVQQEPERVPVRAHSRVKRGRKPLPPDLPRVEVIHDIPEEQKICGCGEALTRIGEEVCEKLEIIPAQVRVRRHVRPKYACKACEGSGDEENPAVRIAPVVKQLLPKSIASPALIAYMIVAKFCDALPFYRQERQFQRMGVDISRQVMANWTIAVHRRIEPLVRLVRKQIRSGPVVGIDETTVQVMNEPDRANTSQSYMWVFLGGEPKHPVVEYQYHPTRSGSVPLQYLKGYRGYIQTDAYEGYGELGRQPGIVHSGCWAHARRRFFEAQSGDSNRGSPALADIRLLYKAEKAAQDMKPQLRRQVRQERSRVQLESFKRWLQKQKDVVLPKRPMGDAVNYALSNWESLVSLHRGW